MSILNKLLHNSKTGHNRFKPVADRWLVSLLCLLIVVLTGMLVDHRQALGTGVMAATQLEPVQQVESGQVQQILNKAASNDKLAATPSIWPASGAITSNFGWRNSPYGGGSEFHPGIDIASNMGTPVVATADGIVVQSEWSEGYGNIVQIDHGHGIVTLYGHNSQILVTNGQAVKKGQVIAYAGSTGRSTGPHVHYELRVNGTAVDPIRFLVFLPN